MIILLLFLLIAVPSVPIIITVRRRQSLHSTKESQARPIFLLEKYRRKFEFYWVAIGVILILIIVFDAHIYHQGVMTGAIIPPPSGPMGIPSIPGSVVGINFSLLLCIISFMIIWWRAGLIFGGLAILFSILLFFSV